MLRTKLTIVSAVLLALLMGATSFGATVPLSELVNGGTIQSEDKIFSNFTYTKNGDTPSVDAVVVEDIIDADGNPGIRIVGPFIDRAGGDASDALITFDVTAPVGMEIIDAHLQANPAVINGDGLASITETFLPQIIDQKLVVFDFGNGDDKLADAMNFPLPGFQTLSVQKDIILHAMGDGGAVTLSFVDQTFSQVPEPSAFVLLAMGALCFACRRRR